MTDRALLDETTMFRHARDFLSLARIAIQIVKSKVLRRRIPVAVSIHVTNKCNLRCKYCYSNVGNRFNKNVPDFSTAQLKKYIREMKELGTRWIIFLGGEPLLREDIGELIRFVKAEGMLCELVTNGLLIEEKLEDIKNVDLVCLSLDGNKRDNDMIRGKGSYDRAVRGLAQASRQGLKVRIHAVLTRHNATRDSLFHLCTLARKYRARVGYSTPITTGASACELPLLDREDFVAFLSMLKRAKHRGCPVYNSDHALDVAMAWPFDPNRVARRLSSSRGHARSRCQAGHRFCYVDSEGQVYPCIKSGILQGLNVRDVGFTRAFHHLKGHGCGTCALIQYTESNDIIDLKPSGLLLGLKTFLQGRS